jgi:hypothetical protein
MSGPCEREVIAIREFVRGTLYEREVCEKGPSREGNLRERSPPAPVVLEWHTKVTNLAVFVEEKGKGSRAAGRSRLGPVGPTHRVVLTGYTLASTLALCGAPN